MVMHATHFSDITVTCPPQLLFDQAVSISALYHAVVRTVTQWASEQRSALQAGWCSP